MATSGNRMEQIGPYQLIRPIAKGGMGEVFLVYDSSCKREIALKCIRSEYSKNPTIYKRFVKEALIASSLTHPNIIPIYHLHNEGERPYYTMPHIRGKTLKQILIDAKEEQKNFKGGPSSGSIPYLMNIYLTVCEAIAYCHSKNIIHRDLKPENILVGKHGEVLIFDWGVADKIENIEKEDPLTTLDHIELSNLTSPGKIIGTLSFLAPENFHGKPANFLTDIYSLGVMLYMILTLRPPFRRKKVKEAKQNLDKEVFKNPISIAPYRDIPHSLVNIAKKCLEKDPKDRYQSMQELLKDLKSFAEGQSDWILSDQLNIDKEADWEFKENILISNHQAISLQKNAFEWVSLMISKKPFEINSQIEADIKLKKGCQGIGLLINSPSSSNRMHIIDGYFLWLSSSPQKPSLLFRNNVEVLRLPNLYLKENQPYQIRLEKVLSRIIFYLDGVVQFSYLSYLPLMGSHVGLVIRDLEFTISDIRVSTGSPPLIISCLDLPDAFLMERNFDKAIREYRRIGKTFPGRHESREAFFRAGLVILEQAMASKDGNERLAFFDAALDEFESLRTTPGAPLEYLGKSLVYHKSGEIEEELKCLELSLKRYPKHPLLYLIYDHIVYRLYQSSDHSRLDTYKFIFLALRYNAYAQHKQMIDPLILKLADCKKTLFFLKSSPKDNIQSLYLEMIINLSFLLKKSYVYEEILDSYTLDPPFVRNILLSLWLLDENELLKHYLHLLTDKEKHQLESLYMPISQKCFQLVLQKKTGKVTDLEESIFFILIERALLSKEFNLAEFVFEELEKRQLEFENEHEYLFYQTITLLLNKKTKQAKKCFDAIKVPPNKKLFLKGCLVAAEGNLEGAMSFFADELANALPDVDMLGSLYLSEQLDLKKWQESAFIYEQKQLYKQLYFFYEITNNSEMSSKYLKKWEELK